MAPSPVWAPGDMPGSGGELESLTCFRDFFLNHDQPGYFHSDPPGLVCLQEQVTVAEVMARKLPSTLILFSLASFTSSMLSLVLSLNSALWSRSKGAKHSGQPWPQESSRREEGVEVGVYLVHKIDFVRLG